MSKCNYNGCDKRATFNMIGEKKAIRYREHMDDNMVDVINPKCIVCNKTASYNIVGMKKGRITDRKCKAFSIL